MKLLKLKSQIICLAIIMLSYSCNMSNTKKEVNQHQEIIEEVTAKNILGNPNYQAISYGGYRTTTRDVQPTIEELKDDLKILHAMNIKVLRTYNVQLAQASNLLKAISELKADDSNFEMYVMLGAWIDCKNAWTDHQPNHDEEDLEGNTSEIQRAVNLANQYPDIVKVIAVGNEAMVKWAESYFVQPNVILKWVNHLQDLKSNGNLPKDIWITSSDNFASWGGGDTIYHTDDLRNLIKTVDFISMHTYPMHDTHYNPKFWGVLENEKSLSKTEQINLSMKRAEQYAVSQYNSTADFIAKIDSTKPIHIGETGWASSSNGFYGSNGSKATDEYKLGLYYDFMRAWTNNEEIACFYFEAFDEIWKDAQNPGGSENHFGLFTIDGKAKYPLWNLVDQGVFDGLTRNGNTITKTYNGDKNEMLKNIELPAIKREISVSF